MTNNEPQILPWSLPTLRSEVNIGKRVHDTREQLGDGTVLDYDSVEALVKYDSLDEPVWSLWGDIEFTA